ncbi:MAG TPA: hypothetical protein VNS10_02760 [Gemmatimonadaceae bacterium]|jgi:hypothetical protein|nr:hypothetical protein [Gemmatimonadaceae bacterium]
MTTRSVFAFQIPLITVAGLVAAGVSCTREPINAPREVVIGAALNGKAATSLSVTRATPSYGDQGTTVDIHVLGSGFTSGAQATWLLHGVADPTHVRTNSTTVVSSSELIANITIANDAQLALWDVQVALAGGKNGVGSEMFEITAAQIIASPTSGGGDVLSYGINQNGQIVGKGRSQSGIVAFIYDDATGYTNMGTGEAWAIDATGGIAMGRDGNLLTTVWIRQTPTTWTAQHLPTLPANMRGLAAASAYAPDGTLLVGGADDSASGTRSSQVIYTRPVVWRYSGGVWSAPQRYSLPAGAVKGTIRAINTQGQAAGRVNDGAGGAIWDSPTTAIRLAGPVNGMNAAATLVVGELATTGFDKDANKTLPVVWWRNPSTGTWGTTAIALPSLAGSACPLGKINAVNSSGVVVGTSCNAAGEFQATAWRLDLTGATPVLVAGPLGLPGLGPVSTGTGLPLSAATAITDAAPYVVAGWGLQNGTVQVAVRWRLVIP